MIEKENTFTCEENIISEVHKMIDTGRNFNKPQNKAHTHTQ